MIDNGSMHRSLRDRRRGRVECNYATPTTLLIMISADSVVDAGFTSLILPPHCTAATLSNNKWERDWSDPFRAWTIFSSTKHA